MQNVIQIRTRSEISTRSVGHGQNSIGEILTAAGKLKNENVDHALRLQEEQPDWERIGAILVKLGFVSERDIVEGLAEQFSIRLVERDEFPDSLLFGREISARFLQANTALVFDEDDDRLIPGSHECRSVGRTGHTRARQSEQHERDP